MYPASVPLSIHVPRSMFPHHLVDNMLQMTIRTSPKFHHHVPRYFIILLNALLQLSLHPRDFNIILTYCAYRQRRRKHAMLRLQLRLRLRLRLKLQLPINPLGQRDTLLSNRFTHVSLRVLEIVLDVGNAVRPVLHHQCPIT